MLVIILMGSPGDAPLGQQIVRALDAFGIRSETRVASAHKTPRYLLDLLEGYESDPRPKVYITVAGRSNALSGMVDAQVAGPVIACPPYSERFAGGDILSSLRVPSGVAPAVVLEPEGAALLAAKMLSLADTGLRHRISTVQEEQRQRLITADNELPHPISAGEK
jgi:5-(carboxyamino)imidazole ribonucleotide mutase